MASDFSSHGTGFASSVYAGFNKEKVVSTDKTIINNVLFIIKSSGLKPVFFTPLIVTYYLTIKEIPGSNKEHKILLQNVNKNLFIFKDYML